MTRDVLVGLIIAITACTPSDWQRAVYGADAVAVAALACDGGSTVDYLHHSQWVELNPVLGQHPGELRLWSYLGLVGAALIVTNHFMPPKVAIALSAIVTAFEVHSIAVNMSIGSSFCGMGRGGPWAPIPK